MYKQYITGEFEESASGTLTSAEILTGCSVGGMLKKEAIGMELRSIQIQFLPAYPDDAPAANTIESQSFALSVTPNLTSLPQFHQIGTLYLCQQQYKAGVATYLPPLHYFSGFQPSHQWIDPVLIANPKIYAYIQGTNAANTTMVRMRLGFTYVELDGAEAIEALEVLRSPVA